MHIHYLKIIREEVIGNFEKYRILQQISIHSQNGMNDDDDDDDKGPAHDVEEIIKTTSTNAELDGD